MKILVFSDSHGYEENIRKVVFQHQLDTDMVLFAGDGIDDINNVKVDYPSIDFEIVGGNREEYLYSLFPHSDIEYEKIISIGNLKILLSHGHKYKVKYSLDSICKYAFEKGIDIVVFGHTHIPKNEVLNSDSCKPLYIINPGSISSSRPSYGLINIQNGIIKTEIIEI